MESLKCRKCLKIKKTDDFCFRKDTQKYRSDCRACVSEYQKGYRAAHAEDRKAYGLKYREDNLDRLLKADRKRYVDNKEELKDKARKHKLSNRDYYQQYNKSYYNNNKELFFAANAKRRARKLMASPTWLTEDMKAEINDKYYQARDCYLVTGEDYHVDHIVPLQGVSVCGLHVPWNLQVLPSDINLSKSNNYDDWSS